MSTSMHINDLDTDERGDDPADPVDEDVLPQGFFRGHRAVGNPVEGEGDERDDDERIEDDCGEDRILETEDVQDNERRVGRDKCCRDDKEIFCKVVCDGEGGKCSPGHQELLSYLHDLDQFCGIALEIDHVRRLAGRLGPGVHRNGDICLGKGRGIVGAVTGHRDHPTPRLVLPDQS